MKKNFDIIACDLDGTLLNNRKSIDPETKKTLLELQRKNKTLVLVSGRYYHELKPYVEELKLKEFHGFAICCNGYEVYDIAKGQAHRFMHIPACDVKQLITQAEAFHLAVYLLQHQHYHMYSSRISMMLLRILQLLSYPISPFVFHKQKHVLSRLQNTTLHAHCKDSPEDQQKLCFLGSKKSLQKFQEQVLQVYKQKYHFFKVTSHAAELVSSTVSKALAVSYVCDHLHTDMEHVAAFGDSGNDKALLIAAGLGIAMKNGYQEIKDCADDITEFTNDQQGVARYLRKYIG